MIGQLNWAYSNKICRIPITCWKLYYRSKRIPRRTRQSPFPLKANGLIRETRYIHKHLCYRTVSDWVLKSITQTIQALCGDQVHLPRDMSGSHKKGQKLNQIWFIFSSDLKWLFGSYSVQQHIKLYQELESLPFVARYSLPTVENVRDLEGVSTSWLVSSL